MVHFIHIIPTALKIGVVNQFINRVFSCQAKFGLKSAHTEARQCPDGNGLGSISES